MILVLIFIDVVVWFDEFWLLCVFVVVDDMLVKVVKVYGLFIWYSYVDEDELFYVLCGLLCIELEDGVV